MKAGIITFHNVINYGAVLQALALQETLINMGVDARIINYTPDDVVSIYKPFCLEKYRRQMRKSVKIAVRSLVSDIRHFRFLNKKNKAFESFGEKHYKLSGKPCRTLEKLQSENLSFDACFAGSDQIWNPEITCGFDPAYFLDFGDKSMIRASYAASIGKASFTAKEQTRLKELLSDFDSISMREATAAKLVKAQLLFRHRSCLTPPCF